MLSDKSSVVSHNISNCRGVELISFSTPDKEVIQIDLDSDIVSPTETQQSYSQVSDNRITG